MTEHLTREDAARELARLLGWEVTKATMEKLAERGGGPPYVILLGRAAYPREPLLAWARSAGLLRPPKARAQRARVAPEAHAAV
jgi:hypothetical protein